MISIKTSLLVFLTILPVPAVWANGNQCTSLFETAKEGVHISKSVDLASPATVILTESKAKENAQEEAIKIVRQALVSPSYILSDKNFISKDDINVGYTFTEGYTLNVLYKSDSRFKNRFIIKEINLITPTNYKVKLSDTLFKEDRFELSQNQFDVNQYFPLGTQIEAHIPFFIEAKTLEVLDHYNSYFSLFKKEELKKIFSGSSPKKIQSLLTLRRAKDVFRKVLIKQPYKMIIGLAVSFSALSYNNSTIVTPITPITPMAEKVLNSKSAVKFVENVKDPKSESLVPYEIAVEEFKNSERLDFEIRPATDSALKATHHLERSGF